MITFSIIIPVYPPHFGCLTTNIKEINDFIITDAFEIKEVIISASGTNDKSLKISEPCKYPIILDCVQTACNASKNRNRGWEKATGDFIVFIDADDFYHKEKLKITAETILKYPDVDSFTHGFHGGRNPAAPFFVKPIAPFKIVGPDVLFKSHFAKGEFWQCNPRAGGCSLNLPGGTAPPAHGIITVRRSSTIRFREDLNAGEDGYFCREQVFLKKHIHMSVCLMMYTHA